MLRCGWQLGTLLGVALAALGSGCDSSSGPTYTMRVPEQPAEEDPEATLGERCGPDVPCPGELTCLVLPGNISDRPLCSKPCEHNSDCGSDTQCGVAPDGSRMCLDSCGSDHSDIVCLDGVPTACAATDGSQCQDCGCPKDEYCREDEGCFAIAQVGDACDRDAGCSTSNCDKYSHVCRVAVGQPCSANDCERCISLGGWSYCSRECREEAQCNGGKCISSGLNDFFTCYMVCPDLMPTSCPVPCHQIIAAPSDDSYRYCECEECEVATAARPLGARCVVNGDCLSGDCFGLGNPYTPFCSQPCEVSSDCGQGVACVDVPCTENESQFTCGRHCAPLCEGSGRCDNGNFCQVVTAAEGETVSVCELKRPPLETCFQDSHCQSGACRQEECKFGPGLPPGSACQATTDCDSHNCINGVCYGNDGEGELCSDALQCQSGKCCRYGNSNLFYCTTGC